MKISVTMSEFIFMGRKAENSQLLQISLFLRLSDYGQDFLSYAD